MQTVQDELAPAPVSSLDSLADAAESGGPKQAAMPDPSADPSWPAGVGYGAASWAAVGSPQLAPLLSSTPTPAVPETQNGTACASALDLLAAAAAQTGESAQQPAGLDASAGGLSWPAELAQGSASWAEAGGPDQAPLLSSTPTAAAAWGGQDDTGHASPSGLDFLADAAAAEESGGSTQPSASAGFGWSAVVDPDAAPAAPDGSLTQPSKHAGMPMTMAQQQQCT